MNDGYEEILVKKKKTASDTAVKVLFIIVTCLLLAVGVMSVNALFLVAGAAVGFISYYLILPRFDLEYEYLYVGGDIDIDKIMSRRSRKKVGSYSRDKLEIMAPEGSDQLSSYLKNGKVKDYTSREAGRKAWVLVYGTEGGADIVKLELTDDIAQDMRKYAPRKVFFS